MIEYIKGTRLRRLHLNDGSAPEQHVNAMLGIMIPGNHLGIVCCKWQTFINRISYQISNPQFVIPMN